MRETKLRIRIYGDAVLRKKARPVDKVTDFHRGILSQMAQLMYENAGVGLASPQVGLELKMIVVDAGGGLYKLINPEVVKKEGWQENEEGCLSVPGVCIKVRRAKKIKVEGLDELGNPLSLEAENLLACVLQHEIDHLKGRLILDYASFLDKLKIRKKIEELKKKVKNEKLCQSETKSCKLQL